MKKIKQKIKKEAVIGGVVLTVIVIAVISFFWCGIYRIEEIKKLHEAPDGYEKVWIQEKDNDFFTNTLDGYISVDEIDVLLNKSSAVKIYQESTLKSYTYFTVEDLQDVIVTVGKHSSNCDDCR